MAVSRVVVVVVVSASFVAQEVKVIMAKAENREVRMSDFFITIVSSLITIRHKSLRQMY
jgi:nitrogen regulatory protein PII